MVFKSGWRSCVLLCLFALLFVSLVSGGLVFPERLSSNQGVARLSIAIPGNASSVFFYPSFPVANFSCPKEWFKDADASSYLHCACAAPCTAFSLPVLSADVVVPSVGEHGWRVAYYDVQGRLVSGNASGKLAVEQPANLSVSLGFPAAGVSGQVVIVPFVLKNDGVAVARNVSLALSGSAFDRRVLSFANVSGVVEGNVSVKLLPVSEGVYRVDLEAGGFDANSGAVLYYSVQKTFTLKSKATVELSGVDGVRVPRGGVFDLRFKARNSGSSDVAGLNVFLDLAGFKAVEATFPPMLGGGGVFDGLFALSAPNATGVFKGVLSVSGKDGLSGEAVSTSVPVVVTVQNPGEVIVLNQQASSASVSVGQQFAFSAVLKNIGGATVEGVNAFLSAGGACIAVNASKPVGKLAGGEGKRVEWLVSAGEFGGDCVLTVAPGVEGVQPGSTVFKASSSAVAVQAFARVSFAGRQKDSSGKPVVFEGGRVVTDAAGDRLVVPLYGASGRKVGEVEVVREGEVVSSARLSAFAPEFDSASGKASAFLSVGLNSLPADGVVGLNLSDVLPEGVSFASLASSKGLALDSKPVVLVVDKQGLTDGKEVSSSRVVFLVDPAFLAGRNASSVVVFRQSGGVKEVLATEYAGRDGQGRLLFSARAAGLSVFAAYVVKELGDFNAQEPSKATGLVASAAGVENIAAVLLVGLLLAASYVFYARKTGFKPKTLQK